MDDASLGRPLDQISTLWSVVRLAHGGAPAAAEAQRLLLLRYGGAVHRYLLGALRDNDAADELFQQFSLRLLRGDLKSADPERGRFRHFVKGVLFHLIADHHRQRVHTGRLPDDIPDESDPAVADREFLQGWREQLLNGAWKALAHLQRQTGQPFHSVLLCRADHPELSSAQMAELLSASLGRPVTAAWVRQNLHRARDKFAELLVQEVLHTLERPTVDQLEEELIDLALFEHCRDAVARYRAGGSPSEPEA
jgi:RNA polymerase sigma-70 factor (ECF subfamily)